MNAIKLFEKYIEHYSPIFEPDIYGTEMMFCGNVVCLDCKIQNICVRGANTLNKTMMADIEKNYPEYFI